MKQTKNNHKHWINAKLGLLEFLNKQIKGLPKDWTDDDHLQMVMETAITQCIILGYTDKEVQSETNFICKFIRDRVKRKLH